MRGFRLIPQDVVLFKDGRSFEAGESSRARSLMPLPPPETLYGMLRTTVLTHHGIGFSQVNALPQRYHCVLGTADCFGSLNVQGPFAASKTDWFLNAPNDVVPDSRGNYHYLRPSGRFESNLPDGLQPLAPAESSAKLLYDSRPELLPVNSVDPEDNLRRYLLCQRLRRLARMGELLVPEAQPGLERDRTTGGSKSGRLFSVSFFRPNVGFNQSPDAQVSYRFNVAGDDSLLPTGPTVVALGGERRTFWLEGADLPLVPSQSLREAVHEQLRRAQLPDGTVRFRLVLALPALFPIGGWRPCGWAAGPATDNFGSYTLEAAAVGRPLLLSGWDLNKRGPKATQAYAPPGSVYFVVARPCAGQDLDAFVDHIFDLFWWRPLCHPPLLPEAPRNAFQLGLGLSLIGGFPE